MIVTKPAAFFERKGLAGLLFRWYEFAFILMAITTAEPSHVYRKKITQYDIRPRRGRIFLNIMAISINMQTLRVWENGQIHFHFHYFSFLPLPFS